MPGDVNISDLRTFADRRGSLCFAELGAGLPFTPARVFLVWNVPAGELRGQHAHRICEQLLICTHGAIDIVLDNGRDRRSFTLDSPDKSLHVPAGLWGEQRYASEDACLMVLASHVYDPSDYIVDYEEFLSFSRGNA